MRSSYVAQRTEWESSITKRNSLAKTKLLPMSESWKNARSLWFPRSRASRKEEVTAMAGEANELLASLSPQDYSLLRPHLTRIHLEQHEILQKAAQPIDFVYFPLSGMISLVAALPTGEEVEIAGIGKEGAVGTKIGLLPQLAFAMAVIHIPGAALRIPLETFQDVAKGHAAITHIATCANDVMIANLQQSAVCNALHGVEARLARWLLHAQDRNDSETIPLTQEFLAQMLGVRRTTVSIVAATMEKRGLIQYQRGKIRITDKDGLSHLACDCYRIMQKNIDLIVDAARVAKRDSD